MVAGAGVAKLMKGLKDRKQAKDLMATFKANLEKAEKEAKEKIKKLPKKDRDYVLKLMGELPRK